MVRQGVNSRGSWAQRRGSAHTAQQVSSGAATPGLETSLCPPGGQFGAGASGHDAAEGVKDLETVCPSGGQRLHLHVHPTAVLRGQGEGTIFSGP